MKPFVLLLVLLLVCLFSSCAPTAELSMESRARAALAFASQIEPDAASTPAKPARALKSCGCSSDCPCGCQEGLLCDCDKKLRAAPAQVVTYMPQYQPTYAPPAPSWGPPPPMFAPSFGGFSQGGACVGGNCGGGR